MKPSEEKRETPRQGVNPFTKQVVTIQPRPGRVKINPFTGKPVP